MASSSGRFFWSICIFWLDKLYDILTLSWKNCSPMKADSHRCWRVPRVLRDSPACIIVARYGIMDSVTIYVYDLYRGN
jgi:hypothetical protein